MTRQQQIWNADNHYRELGAKFNTFENGAKWADAHPAWIPVEEELPEDNTQVLAYNGKFNEVHLVDYRNGIFEDYYGAFSKCVITHWMPLPKAPKKGSEQCVK